MSGGLLSRVEAVACQVVREGRGTPIEGKKKKTAKMEEEQKVKNSYIA